jgi:3-oxoacyl-[acyl-carrier protein] reductase
MDLGLTGKVALVTGGSGLLGSAIAHALALEGARVVISARNEQRLNQKVRQFHDLGLEVTPVVCDVCADAQVMALTEYLRQHFGGLDVLVNGPGGVWEAGAFSEVALESYKKGFDLNVLSVVRVAQAILPLIRTRDFGRILNIGAFYAAPPLPDLYRQFAENIVAKNALAVLTKTMSEDLAPKITVNCIAPGPVGENHPMLEATGAFPIPRVCTPEDAAALAAFLCSSQAGYITGLTIPLDGGADRRAL